MRKMMIAAGLVSLIAAPVWAQGVEHAPPGGAYKKVSELVKLPDFLHGLGTLYVNPSTLPPARSSPMTSRAGSSARST
jgi:hypothetical protein